MWSARPNSSTTPSALLNADPDEYFQCPYDPHHRILASRFSHHLKRCGKIHGDKVMKTCPYNSTHIIPAEKYEEHLRICTDRVTITQDIERDMGMVPQLPRPAAPKVFPHADEEDWEAEVEEERHLREFHDFMGGNYDDDLEEADDNFGDFEDEYIEETSTPQGPTFNEPLLEEKPANWDSMTAAQKKNYKRKYKRQQERLKASGFVLAEKSKNPEDWTEEERKERIDAILAKYPLVGKANASFTDYKSLLNQICQKCRINAPIYRSAAGDSQFGGFGAECIIKSEVYRSHGYQGTKRDAEHNAAYWTLLAMDVPLEGDIQGRIPSNVEQMRQKDETRRLALSNAQQQQQVKKLRQPGMSQAATRPPQQQPRDQSAIPQQPVHNGSDHVSNIMNTLGKLQFSETSQPTDRSTDSDGWQTVGSKNPAGVKGSGAGRGRGRGRGRGNWSSK